MTFQNHKTRSSALLSLLVSEQREEVQLFWRLYLILRSIIFGSISWPVSASLQLAFILYCTHTLWQQATHMYTGRAYTRDLDFHLYPCTPPIKIHLSLRNHSTSAKHMCLGQDAYFSFTLLTVPEKWLNCEWMWLWSAVRVWGQIRQMKVCGCQASCCWPRMVLG